MNYRLADDRLRAHRRSAGAAPSSSPTPAPSNAFTRHRRRPRGHGRRSFSTASRGVEPAAPRLVAWIPTTSPCCCSRAARPASPRRRCCATATSCPTCSARSSSWAPSRGEAALVSVPPYHIAGIAAMLTLGLLAAGASCSCRRFDPTPGSHRRDAKRSPTRWSVPTMLARILDVLDGTGGDGRGVPSLRHLSYGGGRMPLPVIERAMRLLPDVDFVNAYGLTETSSTIAVLGPDDHRAALASDDAAVRAPPRLGRPAAADASRSRSATPTARCFRPASAARSGCAASRSPASTSARDDGADDGWFPTNDGGWLDAARLPLPRGAHRRRHRPRRREHVPGRDRGRAARASGRRRGGGRRRARRASGARPSPPSSCSTRVRPPSRPSSRDVGRPPPVVASTASVVEVRDELPYNETGKLLRRVLREQLTETHAAM